MNCRLSLDYCHWHLFLLSLLQHHPLRPNRRRHHHQQLLNLKNFQRREWQFFRHQMHNQNSVVQNKSLPHRRRHM
jgi:hypothetical protein